MNDTLFRPSSMLRRRLCPGSLALESTLPAKIGDEPDDEYQSEGRTLHRLVADPSLPRDELKPSQLDLVLAVERMEEEFLGRILQGKAEGWIHNSEKTFVFIRGDKLLFSGTPDAVWAFTKPRVVAVADRKMGYKEVAGADCNLQLRTYIVMVADVYPADRYYGIICQPRISSRPVTVEYSPEDVVKARAEIERIYDLCCAPDAPRRASNEACQYCEAKAVCPEFKAWVGAVTRASRLPVAQWGDEEMDLFESRRGMLEKFLKETHQQIVAIKTACPERLPGYSLKPGANVRSIADLIGAWSALKKMLVEGFGDEVKAGQKFSGCCDASIGALEDLIYDMFKDTPRKMSQKDCKRLLNSLLTGLLEYRQNKPSLVKDE